MVTGIFNKNSPKLLRFILSVFTCNQLTFHHVHHLYPSVPFYRYSIVWDKYKDMLEQENIPNISALDEETVKTLKNQLPEITRTLNICGIDPDSSMSITDSTVTDNDNDNDSASASSSSISRSFTNLVEDHFKHE